MVDNTVAFTSCTAIRAAMPIAVCWIGSISRLNTSMVALLAGEHCRQRIIGEHDHEVRVAVVERRECRVLVVDESLRIDELVELIARFVQHLLVDRPLLADEQVRSRIVSCEKPVPNSSNNANGPTTSRASKRGWRRISASSLRTNVCDRMSQRHGPCALRSFAETIGWRGGAGVADGSGVASARATPRSIERHDAAPADAISGAASCGGLTMTLDDTHEGLVVVDDVLGRLHQFEPERAPSPS